MFDMKKDMNRSSVWGTQPILLALLSVVAVHFVSAEAIRTQYSDVDLLSENASLPSAGGSIEVGLYLKPDPTWHAYWTNPGDAGKEPSIRWDLPEGFEASELTFPTPHVIPFESFITYGYDEPILLLSTVTVPSGLEQGTEYELSGRARWVICDDQICVPERADISISMMADDGGLDDVTRERFADARSKQPKQVSWPAGFEVNEGITQFQLKPDLDVSDINEGYLFVESRRLVRYDKQESSFTRDSIAIRMDASARSDEVISTNAVYQYETRDGKSHAVTVEIERGEVEASPAAVPGSDGSSGGGFSISNPQNFIAAIIAAFIGGVILNVMPCVFPILSIKALSLINMAHGDRSTMQISGVMYTVGVLVTFAAIGIFMLAIRAAGEAVGWGFQLQMPIVNMALALLMVAIGMNLFGVFEIGTSVMGLGESLTTGGEKSAAFFTGLLAVVVATPCVVPFMAPAIGWAFTQPALISLPILLALGLGLAFPYLILSYVPAVGKALPKPGPWMYNVKQILAFPMLLTAVWLFWVVGRQLGVTSMAVALLAGIALCFALWAYGRSSASTNKVPWRVFAGLGLIACVAITVNVESTKQIRSADSGGIDAGNLGGLALENFNPQRVEEYVDQRQPLFLYFTADWCVTCKANERIALATDKVASAFNSRNIKVVMADWTQEDPVITEWLERYDRVGVPLYLYFPSGSTLNSPQILPQALLPDTVISAVDAADGRSSS